MEEDNYRHIEEDEGRLIKIALQLDPAVRDIMRRFGRACVSLEQILDSLRTRRGDVKDIKDIVVFDELENVQEGAELYRDYSSIKDLAAVTVMLAEVIVTAKDTRAYEFRFLSDYERKDAKMEVEKFASYKGLFRKMQDRQETVMGALARMRRNPTAEAVIGRIQKMGISQEPIAVFELPADQRFDFLRRSRYMPRHYLCMISDNQKGVMRASHLHLFSKYNQLPLRESYYFNPGVNQEDEYEVRKHFEC